MEAEGAYVGCHMSDLFNQLQEQDKKTVKELLYPFGRINDCYNPIDGSLEHLAFSSNISNNTEIVKYITESVRNSIDAQRKNSSQDDFYSKFTAPLVEQKVVGEILVLLQENYPHITFLEHDNPYVEKCLSKYHLDDVVDHYLRRQEVEFDEIKAMIFLLFRDSKIHNSLISGGQNIVDVGSGRGELALSLIYEVYQKQLKAVGLPLSADPDDVKKDF